jgi:hypothetical protein
VLPVNSGQIVETHNIDTNKRCAEAVVTADSLSKIEGDLKLQKFATFEAKLPELPFGSDDCQFKLDNISEQRTALAKENEIIVLDIETNKIYYWSF